MRRLRDLGSKRLGRQGPQTIGLCRGERPHHRYLSARQRQQREHRAALEPLKGAIPVRPLASEVRNQRQLSVIALGGGDAGRVAHKRIRAVGSHNQLCAKRRSVAERKQRRVLVDLKALAAMGRGRAPVPERALQRAVLDDPRELGSARLVGVELQHRARVVAENAHAVHRRQALGRQCGPDAERAQELDVARAERIDARIEAVERGKRWCRADENHRRCAQRAHEAGADRPAPDDDEIGAAPVYNVGP